MKFDSPFLTRQGTKNEIEVPISPSAVNTPRKVQNPDIIEVHNIKSIKIEQIDKSDYSPCLSPAQKFSS
jgi:hypothetical protein